MDGEEILEFGIKRENEERRDGGFGVIFDPETQKYAAYNNLKNGHLGLYGGGFNIDEDEQVGVLREVIEESGLTEFLHVERIEKVLTHYHNSNKGVNRVAFATCYLIILKNTNLIETKLEEHENFELVWLTPPEILARWNLSNKNKDYDHWVHLLKKSVKKAKELGYGRTSDLNFVL